MKNLYLNEKQQEAIDHIEGPLLVLAGAGSGKTRVVTQKIVKLIEIGVDPSQILAVTFTNKAANEMLNRVKEITTRNVFISTFHSLGARILKESINHLGYNQNFTIYDEEDSLKLLKESLNSLNFKEEKETLKKIRYKISTFKNELLNFDDINTLSLFDANEIKVFEVYQNKLKNFNALDFDDLLYLPIELFKKNEKILNYYQNKWLFILIDEYQDTNFAQYTLSKLLSLKHQNICVVGDPDQSIYSFRGAKYQNILNFDKDFEKAKIIKLEKNYRSTKTILDASNSVIKNNQNRFEKDLYSDNINGEKILVFKSFNEKKEAVFVIEKIKSFIKEKINLNQIAIFYRTNFQSRIFEDYLIGENIPYIIYGGISFYQRKEIKDILSFLSLILSNSDFLSFSRTINLINKGFGKATINKLFLLTDKLNIPILSLLYEIQNNRISDIKLNVPQKQNLEKYLNVIRTLKEGFEKKLTISELIEEIIKLTNYLDHLKEDPLTFEDRKKNIDELILKATDWENEKTTSNDQSSFLKPFLEELSLATSKIEKTNEDSIKLMTLHNSKGLEFEVVFIVGLEEDLLPHVNSRDSLEEMEEERRLFYVGMTRAKKYLFLTHTHFRFIYGMDKFSIPSRFLKEIPKTYIKDLNNQEEEESSSSFEDYEIGQKIFHSTFGIGFVQKKYETSLGQTLDILFENNQMKSIVTKYAKLKVIN